MVKRPYIDSFTVNDTELVSTLSPLIRGIEYDSKLFGATSTLAVEFLFGNGVVPDIETGDEILVTIGYLGTTDKLDTGIFTVDRIDFTYSPNIMRVGATTYDFGLGFSGTTNISYSNATLRAIVGTQAAAPVVDLIVYPNLLTIDTFIAGTRDDDATGNFIVTSKNRLSLLSELGQAYGYVFNIRGGTLIFDKYEDMEGRAVVGTLTPSSCEPGVTFDDNRAQQIKQAWVEYVGSGYSIIQDQSSPNPDIIDLRSEGYYASVAAADRRALGEIKQRNTTFWIGNITTEGSNIYQAGSNLTLSGWGNGLDGKWNIIRAVHELSPSKGWSVDLEIRKINV